MDRSELLKVIFDDSKTEVESESVMEAYHQLDDLGEYYLSELIDNYILGKLDAREKKIFESHLGSCAKCKKELTMMRIFIKGAKEIGDEAS